MLVRLHLYTPLELVLHQCMDKLQTEVLAFSVEFKPFSAVFNCQSIMLFLFLQLNHYGTGTVLKCMLVGICYKFVDNETDIDGSLDRHGNIDICNHIDPVLELVIGFGNIDKQAWYMSWR